MGCLGTAGAVCFGSCDGDLGCGGRGGARLEFSNIGGGGGGGGGGVDL